MARGWPNPWREDEDATLRRLWSKNAGATAIASVLGRSRNAVCGRAFRIGIMKKGGPRFGAKRVEPRDAPPRVKPKRTVIRRRPVKRTAARLEFTAEAFAERIAAIQTLDVRMIDLKAEECRWPTVPCTESVWRFCGHPQAEDSSYCLEHKFLSFKAPIAAGS